MPTKSKAKAKPKAAAKVSKSKAKSKRESLSERPSPATADVPEIWNSPNSTPAEGEVVLVETGNQLVAARKIGGRWQEANGGFLNVKRWRRA